MIFLSNIEIFRDDLKHSINLRILILDYSSYEERLVFISMIALS